MRNHTSGNYFSLGKFPRHTCVLAAGLALALLMSLPSQTCSAIAKDEVTPIRKFTGKVVDSALLSKLPAGGVVVDEANWNSLWTAWRADQAILKVNFQNQIVLVATASGPNNVMTSSLNLTSSGDLRYEAASTRMAGAGFGYALLIVPRDRIVSVNGHRLPAAPVAKPASLPPMTAPPTAGNKPISDAKESIHVQIQGRVRTGVMSRAKSTGTMVVANGIVWELDLRNDPQLVSAAKELGTEIGTIKGTLSKIESPDRSFRWVVNVESLGPAGSADENEKIAPTVPKTVLSNAVETEVSGTSNQADSKAAENMPAAVPSAQSTSQATPTIPVAQQTGFKSIVISATGGRSKLERKQTVAADGVVTLEVPKTSYSESFSLAPASLVELHKFVASTDWKSVPRSTGTVGKDVTNFSITVETTNGTKRFFIDGASIKSQPVIAKLFSLMRKPAAPIAGE